MKDIKRILIVDDHTLLRAGIRALSRIRISRLSVKRLTASMQYVRSGFTLLIWS